MSVSLVKSATSQSTTAATPGSSNTAFPITNAVGKIFNESASKDSGQTKTEFNVKLASDETSEKMAAVQTIVPQKGSGIDKPLQTYCRESLGDALKRAKLWDATEAEIESWLKSTKGRLVCQSVPHPQVLKCLNNLRELHIYATGIKVLILPPEIAELSNLKKLYIDNIDAPITIPPEVERFSKLTDLTLYGTGNNASLSLVGIQFPSKLEYLIIERIQIQGQVFPKQNLPKLCKLILDSCNLTVFEIGEMGELLCLDLRNNALTELNSEIGKLQSLIALILDNCKLKTLPTQFGELKLTTFSIEGNPIDGSVLKTQFPLLSKIPYLSGVIKS